MMKKLASINLTFWCLAVLIIWMAMGWIMGMTPAFREGIQSLNDMLVWNWLLENGPDRPLISIWLVTLTIISGLLFANLAACAWVRLWPMAKVKSNDRLRRNLRLAMHIFMAVVMIGHAASLVVGLKVDRIKLVPGKFYALPDGGILELKEVVYVNDPAILQMDRLDSRRYMGRDSFDRYQNRARVIYSPVGGDSSESWVRMLDPMHVGNVRVALTGFFVAKDGKTLGGIFAVADNVLTEGFFAVYLLMILSLLTLTMVEWRRADGPGGGKE